MNNIIKNNALLLLNQIPPGAWRAKFVLIMLVIVFGTLILFPAQSGLVIIFVVSTYLTFKLLRHISKLYPTVNSRIIRKTWKLVIGIRQFYKVSEEVEFFHAMTIVVVLISFIFFLATRNLAGYAHFNSAIVILLSSAAFFDVISRISWLTKKAWAKVVGKAAIAGIGAAIIFVASAAAKKHIGDLTHADPKYFPEYAGLLTSIYTPLLFGIALTGIGLLWACLEFLGVVFILTFIVMPLSILFEHPFSKEYAYRFFSRLKSGKKSTFNSTNSSPEWKWLIYVMRPIAAAIAIYVIASSFGSLISYFSEGIAHAEKRVLVMMQYRQNSECTNLNEKALIANLKDNIVSEALVGAHDVIFNVKKCISNPN